MKQPAHLTPNHLRLLQRRRPLLRRNLLFRLRPNPMQERSRSKTIGRMCAQFFTNCSSAAAGQGAFWSQAQRCSAALIHDEKPRIGSEAADAGDCIHCAVSQSLCSCQPFDVRMWTQETISKKNGKTSSTFVHQQAVPVKRINLSDDATFSDLLAAAKEAQKGEEGHIATRALSSSLTTFTSRLKCITAAARSWELRSRINPAGEFAVLASASKSSTFSGE